MTPRLAVIGPGQMASAIVRGLLQAKWTTASSMTACHPRADRAREAQKWLGVSCVTSIPKAVAGADVVLLGVKPQVLPDVLAQLAGHVGPKQLVISLAAGFATHRIEALLLEVPVVRAMPNLAATVGASATALCPGSHAKAAHLALARRIFEAVGTVEEVPEKLMDAVTGLSGTGPMYVFHLVEAMADAGVKVGLSRDVATRLAMQTVIGSAQLAQSSHLHPAEL